MKASAARLSADDRGGGQRWMCHGRLLSSRRDARGPGLFDTPDPARHSPLARPACRAASAKARPTRHGNSARGHTEPRARARRRPAWSCLSLFFFCLYSLTVGACVRGGRRHWYALAQSLSCGFVLETRGVG